MRAIFAAVIVAAAAAGVQAEVVCVSGRCLLPRRQVVQQEVIVSEPAGVTVVAPSARRVVVGGGAQAHADKLASCGGFYHASSYVGGAEGLGMSSRSPDDAVRRSCFWGTRPVREIGTAWCPTRRAWIAVVRYH